MIYHVQKCLIVCLLTIIVQPVYGADQKVLIENVTEATGSWLDSLDNQQQVAVKFRFDDRERMRWHYFPHSGAGLTLRDMSDEQRKLAKAMLQSVLSDTGATKVKGIMALEEILREIEGSSLRYRDPMRYAFTLYGQPGEAPWGWRIDGHHLALNVSVTTQNTLIMTPLFLGSNPARIPLGKLKGERIQSVEYNGALELINSLSSEQQEQAILFSQTPGNILTGPGESTRLKDYEGIRYPELEEGQRDLLMKLVDAYVGVAHDDFGKPYRELINEDLIDLYFAWAGGTNKGDVFYYRIHGPRVLIEFDNTQNNGNHIHSIWRDPQQDVDRDPLRTHYHHAH